MTIEHVTSDIELHQTNIIQNYVDMPEEHVHIDFDNDKINGCIVKTLLGICFFVTMIFIMSWVYRIYSGIVAYNFIGY